MRVSDWVLCLLAIGATGRFTRLFNGDSITQPLRDWVHVRAVKRILTGHKVNGWLWLNNLLACPWCVSVWVSVPIAFVAIYFPTNRFVLAGLLACTASFVVGNIQIREPEPENDEEPEPEGPGSPPLAEV